MFIHRIKGYGKVKNNHKSSNVLPGGLAHTVSNANAMEGGLETLSTAPGSSSVAQTRDLVGNVQRECSPTGSLELPRWQVWTLGRG